VTQALGILEPFSGEHIPPEALQIQGPNYRKSIIGHGLLSRNRAVLKVLEQNYGSLEALAQLDVYLVEALTGFGLWLRRKLGDERLVCSGQRRLMEMLHGERPIDWLVAGCSVLWMSLLLV